RIVRGVDGSSGAPARYEIFHDVLAEPLLAWRSGFELERERAAARRQRRRLLSLAAAALAALAIVAAIAVFALTQRGAARSQAPWSPDGRLVAPGDAGGTVRVWRASDGRRLLEVTTKAPVTVVAFARGALLFGYGGRVGLVRSRGERIREIRTDGAVLAAA